MTDQELAEIRARTDLASPGPWRWDHERRKLVMPDTQSVFYIHGNGYEGDSHDEIFVAHARMDVPNLLQEIHTLKGILADMQQDSTAYQLGIAEGRKQILDAAKAHVDGKLIWTALDGFIEKMENVT